MTRTLALSAFLLAASLASTTGLADESRSSEVDQSRMCIATTDAQAMECPEGELFMARLSQSNQAIRAFNVLNTAALYCDTNHPIFENAAGVICVMTHQRIDEMTTADSAVPGMESQASGQEPQDEASGSDTR